MIWVSQGVIQTEGGGSNFVIDTFTGETSNGAAQIALTLSETPKAIGDIILPDIWNGAVCRPATIISIVGKTLTIEIQRLRYYRASGMTTGASSGNSGADPHSHTVSSSLQETVTAIIANEAQGTIKVIYEKA